MMWSSSATQSTYKYDDLAYYGYIDGESNQVDIWESHVTELWDSTGSGGLGLSKTGDVDWQYATFDDWPQGEEDYEAVSSREGLLARPALCRRLTWGTQTLGAQFDNIVNGNQGYIIAGNNVSPVDVAKKAAEEDPDTAMMAPPLSKWSDIVAIQWSEKAASGGAALQYVVRSGIRNANTIEMIRKAFKVSGETTVGAWPGVDFEPTDATDALPSDLDDATQAFIGLLGTYHAAGPAYLLAQHHDVFGGMRYISKIRIWSYQGDW